jgi:hypothetical protein
VSPLWRDEIGIHVSPGRLCMVRLQRGLRPAIAREYEHALPARQSGDWNAPLTHLAGLLATPEWQRAGAKVVIADAWVRYAIVPWVAELSSSAERLAHARQLMVSAYGDGVQDWELRLSDAAPGTPRVACAIPAELLLQIRTLLSSHRIRLLSLQSQLGFAYANWRHELPAAGSWFVTIGEGTLAAARLTPRCWDRVHTVRIGQDWTRELKRLQTFGRLASANPEDGLVYVDAPQAWREVAGDSVQNLRWLESDAVPPDTLQRLGRVRRMAA